MLQRLNTGRMRNLGYLFSVLTLSAMLHACGFHLRQPAPIAFKTVYISGGTALKKPLSQALTEQGIKSVTSAEDAELQLELIKEEREQRILSLSGTGVVREYELYYRVQYRTKALGDATWSLPLVMESRRDYTYNDANLLAKQTEQMALTENMRTEVMNGILRRISALQKAQ